MAHRPNPRFLKPTGRISAPRRAPRSRNSGNIPALSGLLLLLAAGGGGILWWLSQNPNLAGQPAGNAPSTASSEAKGAEDYAGTDGSENLMGDLESILTGPSRILGGDKPAPPTAGSGDASPVDTQFPAAETFDLMGALSADDSGTEAPLTPEELEMQTDFGPLLVLEVPAAQSGVNVQARKKALDLAFSTSPWDAYRTFLARSLRAWLKTRFNGTQADGLTALFENPHTSEVLLRHAFLNVAGKAIQEYLKSGEDGAGFLHWIFDTPEVMRSFTLTVTAEDDIAAVFRVWNSIVAEDPVAATTTYRELALACGLVFDQLTSVRWNGQKLVMDPLDRYTFYRDNAEAGRLTGKIRRMSASDLVWVVCAPVPRMELEWALKEADWRQKTWGQSYGFIKYDMEKAVTGKSKKPYGQYTFSEIEKKGGICSDRAYFSANTARAHGIPAAIVGGDGPRGGHAWITWMADEGDWKFAGRLGGYPVGHGGNPQTCGEVGEDYFLRASERRASAPTRVLKARQYLWLATLYGSEVPKAEALLAAAGKAAPEMPAVAFSQLQLWTGHKQESPVADWKKFIAALRRNFRDDSDLMAMVRNAEDEFILPRQDIKASLHTLHREAGKAGDTKGAENGIAPDAGKLAESFRRQGELLVTANDLNGVRGIYRRALADYADDPSLFKALARDLFELVSKDPAVAAKACQDLESACKRYVGRGGGDWFDITSQNSAWQVVADCYRKSGDVKKAGSIERQMSQRREAAKRQAI